MKKYPEVLSKLDQWNKGRKVKLRVKQSGEGNPYQLFLDYIHPGGKRIKKYLKLSIVGDKRSLTSDKNTLELALFARDKANLEVQENVAGVMTPNKKINFIEFFTDYSKTKKDSNYRISMNHFRNFLNKDKLDIRSIDRKLCEKYRDYLLSLDITPYTALHYYITFKATLNQAIKYGYIEKNPAKNISIKYEKKSIERLSMNEVKKLFDTECPYPNIKNGFLFACFTGLRFSDLNNLKFSDINEDRLKIVMQKTKNEIEIKLHPNAVSILEKQKKINKGDRIFIIPTGGKTSKRLRKWIQDADINKDITFHCSRHTFGCMLIENGVDVFTVKKLMGHNDIKTTLQYVEKVDETKDKAIDRLPVL